MPEIEPAVVGDSEQVLSLNRQLHVKNEAFDPVDQWDQKDWTLEEIESGNFFIFRENGQILGAISFESMGDYLKIPTLAVADGAHGMGIGKKLLEFATQKATDENFKSIRINSYKFLNVRDFYLKCGFKFAEPAEESFKGEEYWCFVKNL